MSCETWYFKLIDFTEAKIYFHPWAIAELSQKKASEMSQTYIINFTWFNPISISFKQHQASLMTEDRCWCRYWCVFSHKKRLVRSSEGSEEKDKTFTEINKKRIKNISKRLNIKGFLSHHFRLINQADAKTSRGNFISLIPQMILTGIATVWNFSFVIAAKCLRLSVQKEFGSLKYCLMRLLFTLSTKC